MSLLGKIVVRELAEWMTPFFFVTSLTAIGHVFVFGFLLALSSMLTSATIKWFYLGGITGGAWILFALAAAGSLFLIFITVRTSMTVLSTVGGSENDQ